MMKLLISTFLITCLLLPTSFAAESKHACGAVSLYHLATLLGIEVSLDKTDTALKEKQDGSRITSFAELIACAKALGLELEGVKLTYAELQTFRTPVIAHLKTTFADENPSASDGAVGHFIVVEATTDKWVRLFDIPRETLHQAATIISRDRFLELWTGKTLVLSRRQQQRWQSALSVTPTLHDFGNGKAAEYRIPIQFQNRSSAPLKIVSVTANCNCTVAKHQGNVIPPNGTTPLEVNWDANALNRSFFTTLHIRTDTPKRPHTFVSLGLVREFSFVFIPETLSLQNSDPSISTIKRTVELLNRNETSSKIQKIETSQKWIQPVLRGNPIVAPWRKVNIELNFETEQIPRDQIINETLTVYYVEGTVETKTLTLPISGKVNPQYTLTPNRFFFGRVKATEGKTKAVVLYNQSEKRDLQIEKVETDVGTVQVKQLDNGNRYQVVLALPSLLPTGTLKGKVRIYTNHPKKRLIEVPVFAVVAK